MLVLSHLDHQGVPATASEFDRDPLGRAGRGKRQLLAHYVNIEGLQDTSPEALS